MKFTIFKDWSELPRSSHRLFLAAQKNSMFLSREWFESLTPHVVNNTESLIIACVIDGDTVLAMLPLLSNQNREWTSLTHRYSSLFSLLLAPEQQTESLNCLCQGLKELAFDYLTLAPIADNDDTLLKFQQAMETIGLSCYRNHKAYNWFHRINKNQSYADYLAERPSKVSNTLLRKQRKFKREHGYEIQTYIDTDMKDALALYHNLYKDSWKANEQYENLVNDVVKNLSKRAWPRMAILSVDNKPIAAQLWFVVEAKASIFRLVYDEAWKEFSPGTILMCYLLEHVIDVDKVQEIDFLSGNDSYKKDWMSKRRERQALVCVNKQMTKDKKPISLMDKTIKLLFK